MMYLHNDKQLFKEVVSATANETGLPVAIIEITSYFQKTKIDYDEAMGTIQKIVDADLF